MKPKYVIIAFLIWFAMYAYLPSGFITSLFH
jgi:hypothetical protein